MATGVERSEGIKGGLTFVLFTSKCLEGEANHPDYFGYSFKMQLGGKGWPNFRTFIEQWRKVG